MHHWKRRGCRPEEDEESEIVKEEDDMVAKVFDARLVRKERGKNISFRSEEHTSDSSHSS